MILAAVMLMAEIVTGAGAPAVETCAQPAEPAAAVSTNTVRSVRITSGRADYDRKEGVLLFDRDVTVEDAEYSMRADQLYVFLDGTNDLKRIVALGNVAITNDLRTGTCAKASYSKATNRIVMYGDAAGGVKARLVDGSKRRSEVEGSTVTLDAGGLGGGEGAKRIFGK